LLAQCQHLATTAVPLGSHVECEKGHGRLTTREGQCFDLQALPLAPRWSDSGVHTLVVMKRHTVTLATQKTTEETAYYISNQALSTDPHAQALALAGAIRQHWHVESDNWIRDVTLGFDHGAGHSLLLLYEAKAPEGKKVCNSMACDIAFSM